MRSKNTVWFYALASCVILLDLVTKIAARRLLEFDRPLTVIPSFFDLRLSFNSGGAFGALPDWAPLFIIVALVAVYAIVRLRRTGPQSRSLSVGLGLLMGGAVGNLIDRLFSPDREVTDFLSVHISLSGKTYAWPTFNVADIAIVAGAILVFYHVYLVEKRSPEG